ncbi:heat shock 70 kDa protein 12A-like isoform X2 [Ornithodoros turicata]
MAGTLYGRRTPPLPPPRGASSLMAAHRAGSDMSRYHGVPRDIFDDLPESTVDPVVDDRHVTMDDFGYEDEDPQPCQPRRFHSSLLPTQTVVRQECVEGTVFGVLTTPKCQRKTAFHGRTTVTYQQDLPVPPLRDRSSASFSHSLPAKYSVEEPVRRTRLSTLDYRSKSFLDHSHACCLRDRTLCCRPTSWGERSRQGLENREPINHCFNTNVRVPRQILSDNFQDFCQTMLTSDRQAVDRISNGSQSSRRPMAPPGKPDLHFRITSRKDATRNSFGSDKTSNVQEILKKMTSQNIDHVPASYSATHYTKEKTDTKHDNDALDHDAMQVIKQLDLSIGDEEDAYVDGPPPPIYPKRSSVPTESPARHYETSTRHPVTDAEAQEDNLIEEVSMPGSNKKAYQAFSKTRGSLRKQPCESQGNGVTERIGLFNKNNGLEVDVEAEVHSNGDKSQTQSNKPPSDSGDICVMPDDSQLGRSDTADSGVASRPGSGTGSHFIVVAIDFGTTYSGYAFSFTRDPDNIHMMRKWEGGDPGIINQKTPTTLLLNPDGEFHSFGFTARDVYHDLDAQEAKRWMFFEKFKMTLHSNENLSRDTEIIAANGKPMPALTVFAHALRYFRDQALKELSEQSATTILPDDVRWVVTVPAIWRQPAKQFMRSAAYKAGIGSPDSPDQLIIALEPEAASIYCRKLRMHQLVPDAPPPTRLYLFRDIIPDLNVDRAVEDKPGTRYMVVDCGGGTVDITVHELHDQHGTLKELHKATGGPYGSVGIDMEFEKLLYDIFGADFMEQFKLKRPAGYVDLMVAFEARKRNASPYKDTPLNISLPFSFIDYYKKCKGNSVENAIKKHGNKDVKWSSQGMLRIEPAAMIELFRPTVTNIKQHISNVLNNPRVGTIHYLFLVGGFAESQILQKDIRDAFSGQVKVVIPQGVSLAILRGAVLFGLDPMIVNVRRSRMTYGVGVLNRFIHGAHPPSKLVVKDSIEWCADVLDKFVLADQSVGHGDVVVRSYTPAKAGQTCSIIHIYCSERDDVQFITDPGVYKCGTLILDLSDTKYLPNVPARREIQTRMVFGETEIKVSALDVTTQKCVKADIDFLNQ